MTCRKRGAGQSARDRQGPRGCERTASPRADGPGRGGSGSGAWAARVLPSRDLVGDGLGHRAVPASSTGSLTVGSPISVPMSAPIDFGHRMGLPSCAVTAPGGHTSRGQPRHSPIIPPAGGQTARRDPGEPQTGPGGGHGAGLWKTCANVRASKPRQQRPATPRPRGSWWSGAASAGSGGAPPG